MSLITATDLPPRLAQLAEIIGLPATLRLVEARGGTRIYVPTTYSPEHWLAGILSQDDVHALVRAFRGETIELDRAAPALRAVRDRKILADHLAGVSTAKIALQCSLTQRQVFSILARQSPPVQQTDLFQAVD